MSDNSRNSGILFMAGAIAGGALVYFLQTPRGKRLRDTLIENADNMATDLKDRASTVADTVKSKAEEALHTASNAVASAREGVVGATNSGAEKAQDQISDFQKGVDKAHDKMESKLS